MTRFRSGATYRRISKDMAGDEDGVARQFEDMGALCLTRGIPVDPRHHYVDNDLSATHGRKRPDYERVMAAVARDEVDVIVVTYLNRLWRNARERAEGIEILAAHDVSVLCVKGPELDLTTATGRMLAGVLGAMDTFEVEQMIEREQRKALQKARTGRVPTGPRAFGYTATGGRVVDAEAAEVRKVFDQFLAGASLSGLARDLNARGVVNRNRREWSHNGVRCLLMNERYAGLREYRGEMYPGTWEALVDEATWRQAHALLTNDDRRTSPGPARRHLLSGIAGCGVCGDGTTVTSAQRQDGAPGRRRAVDCYKCRGPVKHLMRAMEAIDRFVEGATIARLSKPDAHELLVDDERPDLADLQEQAKRLRRRLKVLAAEFAEDDAADAAEFKEAGALIRQRLAGVEAQMEHPRRAEALRDLITADDTAAAWRDRRRTPLDRKRAVISLLWEVEILGGRGGRAPFDPATVRIEPR